MLGCVCCSWAGDGAECPVASGLCSCVVVLACLPACLLRAVLLGPCPCPCLCQREVLLAEGGLVSAACLARVPWSALAMPGSALALGTHVPCSVTFPREKIFCQFILCLLMPHKGNQMVASLNRFLINMVSCMQLVKLVLECGTKVLWYGCTYSRSPEAYNKHRDVRYCMLKKA